MTMEDNKRKYYPSRFEAEKVREKGQRIYYTSKKGWYCVTPIKRSPYDLY